MTSFETPVLRKFAVLVPAHNEELNIERTLRNLQSMDYPREKYSIHVVADNCTDKTAAIARMNGAVVLERTNPSLRGKGHALRWSFDQLLKEETGFDAFVIIDADSIVRPSYLRILNYYLHRGAAALQSSDLVEPQPDSCPKPALRPRRDER